MSAEGIAAIAAVILALVGACLGSYIALLVKIEKLQVYVDILQKDMNALGAMIRKTKKEESEK